MASLLIGSDYVGMDDPELFAHAFQMAALLAALRSPAFAFSAALLFVLSLFVKHNLVAMPLAVAIWLFVFDRKGGVRFVGAGIVLGLLGLFAFRVAYGSNLIDHLVSARVYSIPLLAANSESWLAWSIVPLAILVTLVALKGRDPTIIFCALYSGVSVIVGVAFAGGAGVDVNVFFDADIGLALALGVALTRFAETWERAAIAGALLLPVIVGLYSVSDDDWRDPNSWVHPMSDEAATAHSDIDFLRRHRGRALCESLALCYWAGKAQEVDVFNTGQAFAADSLSDAALANRLRSHAYSAIEFDSLEPFALGSHMREVLVGAYRIDHTNDEGVFLVPR